MLNLRARLPMIISAAILITLLRLVLGTRQGSGSSKKAMRFNGKVYPNLVKIYTRSGKLDSDKANISNPCYTTQNFPVQTITTPSYCVAFFIDSQWEFFYIFLPNKRVLITSPHPITRV